MFVIKHLKTPYFDILDKNKDGVYNKRLHNFCSKTSWLTDIWSTLRINYIFVYQNGQKGRVIEVLTNQCVCHFSVDQMSVDQMSVDQMSVDQMSVDQMSVDQMSVDQMSVHQMRYTKCWYAQCLLTKCLSAKLFLPINMESSKYCTCKNIL